MGTQEVMANTVTHKPYRLWSIERAMTAKLTSWETAYAP
jgi:hypothetical protein